MHSSNLKTKTTKHSPAWIVTFADLMALLLTFFIMLFSFSSMDSEKYKTVSKSIEGAFNLELSKQAESLIDFKKQSNDQSKDSVVRLMFTKYAEDNLQQEIQNGLVEINTESGNTVFRFPEKVTFPSGSTTLNTDFIPVLQKVGKILIESKGKILVAGHSDDQPIHTDKYRSNWDLSSGRAASVVHEILQGSSLLPGRIIIQGYADTKSLKPNDTPQNRATNRRVEIIVENNKFHTE